ncbi:MAG: hypothetical protein GEV08_15460 [Acidimicrobiia bacterium]|nr:hypothetical protein [Acidimicrobiia bacterium]
MGASMGEPAQRYLEHLSDADLVLLGAAAGLAEEETRQSVAFLRGRPDLIEDALRAPSTFPAFFPGHAGAPGGAPSGPPAPGGPDAGGALIEATALPSPFLLFAVAVHRAVQDLDATSFVAEPFGGFKRLPVFASAELRALYDDAGRRLFTIEHLASYTRVTSGRVWVRRQGGGYRRVRYSELDPVRLAGLLELVDPEEQAGIYRRLGDLALFLTGVFPDHCARTPAHPIAVTRLVRSVRVPGAGRLDVADIAPLVGSDGLGGVLRVLGPHWYRLAAQRSPLATVARGLDEAASSFDGIRRFLTVLTDRYLFPVRDQFFGSAA